MTVLDIRFSDWIQKGFGIFVNNAPLLIISSLVALVISGITLGLLMGPMLAGMVGIIVNVMDDRLAKPSVNDLFKGFDYFVATLPVTFGYYGLAMVSYVLGMIPGPGFVLNAVVLSVGAALGVLVVYHLVVRKIDPKDSIRMWIELFKMNWGPLLGLFILLAIIGGMGVLAFYVGLVVTIPLYLCILGVAYTDMTHQSAGI